MIMIRGLLLVNWFCMIVYIIFVEEYISKALAFVIAGLIAIAYELSKDLDEL